MKIFQTPSYDRLCLFDVEKKSTDFKNMQDKVWYGKEQTDSVEISEKGRQTLREKLKEIKPEVEEPIGYLLTTKNTNEVAFEHYMAMREIKAQILQDKEYEVKDVMKSLMDAYEMRYNQIVEEHENGDRKVSYSLTGDSEITLEEDLEGLDKAYERCLGDLEGYITCQQTNKAFENPDIPIYYLKRMGWLDWAKNRSKNEVQDDYNYFDKDYQNTVSSIMKLAREEFLIQFRKSGYRKGTAKQIVSNLYNSNQEFMEKTERLFK